MTFCAKPHEGDFSPNGRVFPQRSQSIEIIPAVQPIRRGGAPNQIKIGKVFLSQNGRPALFARIRQFNGLNHPVTIFSWNT